MQNERLRKTNTSHDEPTYRIRFLGAIAFIQFLLILAINIWPTGEYVIPKLDFDIPPQEVFLQEIQITEQRTSPPPPPRPVIPQPVPSDEIIEIELDTDLDPDLPELPELDPGMGTGLFGDEARIVSNPQIPPTVVRIVEASAPEEVPDELKGRIEMIVNFLVDTDGRVEEVSISEIRKYTNGEYEQLEFIQYGIMDAVLIAAMQWRFRPARQDGEPVKAFTKQRFNY